MCYNITINKEIGDIMLKTLIAEDNVNFVASLYNTLENYHLNFLKVVQILSTGDAVYQYLKLNSDQIDLILLDLNLPNINGIQILEKLSCNQKLPDIIVISGESLLISELSQKQFKIARIFRKPFDMTDLVNYLSEHYHNLQKEKSPEYQKIKNLLDQFNFNTCSLGYDYIISCLLICLTNNITHISNAKELYEKVAKQKNIISIHTIKWNIDKAIKNMNRLTESNILRKYFSYTQSLSSKLFINRMLTILSTPDET